jgi:CDP-diacylglycerol--glycerol-3-phosphate 3-phosphatidyltransferase
MVSRWVRRWDSRLLAPALRVLAGAGVTPNMLTLFSLVCMIVAGVVAAQDHLLIAGGALLIGGVADSVDGELARQTGRMTVFGGFLDSICDHCGDFAFSLGLIWHYLGSHATTEIFLVVVALFGSMLGSQIRARAGMAGIATKDIGLATRFERMGLWLVGIFTAHLSLALLALAILNNIAALQRMWYVLRHRDDPQSDQLFAERG